MFGTVRMKMVRVPQKVALILCLHIPFSTVQSGVKYCFGAGKRLHILANEHDSFLVRMWLSLVKHGGRKVFGAPLTLVALLIASMLTCYIE